ncbi:MAG: helix-turn-helix transcriptional regulator, partial [Variovorax sp.]|nr:helix-turn-helix transcriptional regulator [Variovorax sp.]
LASSALQSAFEQRVREACAPAGGARAGVLHLPVAGGVVRITVLPLKPSHPLAVLRQRHRALVVFAHPAEAAVTDPRQMESLLGLSPTEARLALLIASGKTVKDFAAAQQCSEHTARSHLRNVMRKTDCHRQAELVLLVQSLRD